MQQDNDTIGRARDNGTPEIHKQHIVEEKNGRAYVRSDVPIDYYLHRRLITLSQHEAAELLYFLWYHGAEKSSYVTVRDPRMPKGIPNHMRKEQLEQTYNKAMLSIKDVVTRLTVYNVVCIGEWLVGLNKEALLRGHSDRKHYLKTAFGINRRMELLKDGLDQLQKHFRIPDYKEKHHEE